METRHQNRFEHLVSSPQCRKYRHLMLQVLLLILPLNAFITSSNRLVFDSERWLVWIVMYVMLNIVCFFNMNILVPRWFLTGKSRKYAAGVIAEVSVFLFIMTAIQPEEQTVHSGFGNPVFPMANILASFLTICIVILSTTSFMLLRYWVVEQQRAHELEIAAKNAELALLKSQINPHFLFNTLNNANALLRHRPDEASAVLFKMEDLLHYQMNDCVRDRVSLEAEIRFLNDYLNLEKIRRDRFQYTCRQEGAVCDVNIPPLMFIPFVENAVKHNPDSGSSVSLSFAVNDGRLEFRCKNTKSATYVDNRVGGLGLNNIRRRLELLYPNRHTLKIDDGERSYSVRLVIDYD